MTYTLVGIGEILWDVLPSGKQMGGAPANFAYHASRLGEDGRIVSCIGKDEAGEEILNHLRELRLCTDFISRDESHPTGFVTVKLGQTGKPNFTIHEDVAWDYLGGRRDLFELAEVSDAVCFGTLAQRSTKSRTTIKKFLQRTSSRTLRIFDINLRQPFYSKEVIEESLRAANILKLNEEEFQILSTMYGFEGNERTLLQEVLLKFDLELIALTKGMLGSVLCDRDDFSIHPGYIVDAVDTVGAGDAFTAAMAVGLLNRYNLEHINDLANRVASYVCTQSGGTPPIPKRFRDLL